MRTTCLQYKRSELGQLQKQKNSILNIQSDTVFLSLIPDANKGTLIFKRRVGRISISIHPKVTDVYINFDSPVVDGSNTRGLFVGVGTTFIMDKPPEGVLYAYGNGQTIFVETFNVWSEQ